MTVRDNNVGINRLREQIQGLAPQGMLAVV